MQEAGHPQEIEGTEEEGPEGACEFCEIGENCDFTSTRQILAEFAVGFYESLIFRQYKFESQHVTERDVTAVNCQ